MTPFMKTSKRNITIIHINFVCYDFKTRKNPNVFFYSMCAAEHALSWSTVAFPLRSASAAEGSAARRTMARARTGRPAPALAGRLLRQSSAMTRTHARSLFARARPRFGRSVLSNDSSFSASSSPRANARSVRATAFASARGRGTPPRAPRTPAKVPVSLLRFGGSLSLVSPQPFVPFCSPSLFTKRRRSSTKRQNLVVTLEGEEERRKTRRGTPSSEPP